MVAELEGKALPRGELASRKTYAVSVLGGKVFESDGID
jgi:hypothetical protein